MTLPCKPRYRTTNWKHYNAALKARGSLTVWLDKRISWFAAVSGKRGRSPKLSDAAIQFCLTLRQTTGLVQSVLQLCGLTWPVPDFSTLCRRQFDLKVQVPYTRSQAGLPLQIQAICVTSNNVSDASVLPDLLQQLPERMNRLGA